jgi:macrolide transport system ATP-binding/permease protein
VPSPFPPVSAVDRHPDPYADEVGPVVATGVVRTFPSGTRPVLDGIDLVVSPGTRLGLIGENGSGKSTLLRLLAGLDAPDSGTIQVPVDLVYLGQQPETAPDGTVGDLLDTALRPLHAAAADLEALAVRMTSGEDVGHEYDRVLAWATHHDAWDADRRAKVTAAALGVADLGRDRLLTTLSGGQRTRLALAAALVRRPACLLLDEPTNHLDDGALELLESSLIALPGVVVAASHDRVFLDRVCTDVLDLDAGPLGTDGSGGRRFGGSFSRYLGEQADARRRWQEQYTDQQQEIGRLRDLARIGTDAVAANRGPRDNDKFIHHFKGGNVERAHARRVHDAERRLATAEREQVRRPPKPLRFSGVLADAGTDGLVASIRDLRVLGAHETVRLAVHELDVPSGVPMLVTGPNGSGKSTLLAVLAGRLAPDSGTVQIAARRSRLLRQDAQFDDLGSTANATYAAALGQDGAERVPLRSLGLLAPQAAAKLVGALSLGQRRRLDLAIAIAGAPDLLLLDEPSNHLSLRLVGELEEALDSSPGTVVVTSHDRWLRRRWQHATYELD